MKRALVCEDDPAIRTLVRTILKREGFEVEEAENGTDGLRKMDEGGFDVLVLDLMMPEMSGYDVVEKLRPDQVKRVIIMTAVATAKPTDFAQPICSLITKPFDVDRFADLVRDCAEACDR